MDRKFPLRLGKALLKHAVKQAVGDETLEVFADVGLDEAENRVDAWLQESENQQALSAAMAWADDCFMQQVQDAALRQWMHDLPLRDLPSLQTALDHLPASPDESALETALRQAMARDWPGLSDAQRDLAVRVYLLCMRRALLPLQEQALRVIGRSVLRTEAKVDRLAGQLQRFETQLTAWMAREQQVIDHSIHIGGSVYQGIVISGDANLVQYTVNYFLTGDIWSLSSQRLPPPPAPALREEEKVYLRLLRDEADRVPLAEDERRTHKDRSERVALHLVYVDLATNTPPSLEVVFHRLGVPVTERPALRLAMSQWLQGREESASRRLEVEDLSSYASILMDVAGERGDWEAHPLSRWAQDEDELKRALAPLSAVETLARQDNLVLLGDPGSGKSTFVNHLAFTLAGAVIGDEPDWQTILENQFDAPLFPLRIVVRKWSGSLKEEDTPGVELVYRALEMLFNGIDRATLLRRLSSMNTLVMFDGLDESPIAEMEGEFDRRRIILESIRQFRVAHPHCRVLVTSRVRPYDNPDYQLPQSLFASARLAPLDAPRIRRFVTQWYMELARIRDLDEDEAKAYARRLRNAIDRRHDLAEMAPSPLLLTMLAVVNRRSGLPEGRAELYHEVVRQLLWEWERVKAEEGRTISLLRLLEEPDPPLKTIDFERTLWRITYEAHARSGKRVADIPVEDLRKALAAIHPGKKRDAWSWAAAVIDFLQQRSGLLIPVDDDTFTFPHRSFQEYLAARWLLELDDPGEMAVELAENDSWHEVILLACGYLAAKGPAALWKSMVLELTDGMEPGFRRWQAPLLAGLAWKDYGFDKVSAKAARKLRRELPPLLTDIMQHTDIPPAQRLEAGLILADLGVLPDDLDDLIRINAPDLNYPFRIGKYPVTNAQFRRFVVAGGYHKNKPWWTKEIEEALAWDKNWRKGPRLWHHTRFNKATQPVVGVSWFEANAYCQWLTEVWRKKGIIGEDEEVRLPSEAEWEAADGPGRYAWGDAFEPARVNSQESGLDQPAPVHMYPAGASPAGVHVLNGNVWEWTRDRDTDGWPWLRGGAWWNDADGVTSAARHSWLPLSRNGSYGFRVVVVPISRGSDS